MPSGQTGQDKQRFLEGYRAIGTISGGARYAGVSRNTVYQWMKTDPQFAEDVEQAHEEIIDSLEEAAIARAKNKSDLLTIFLLKHNRPNTYGDNIKVSGQVEHRVILRYVPAQPLGDSGGSEPILLTTIEGGLLTSPDVSCTEEGGAKRGSKESLPEKLHKSFEEPDSQS
jgi:hypothetical protein